LLNNVENISRVAGLPRPLADWIAFRLPQRNRTVAEYRRDIASALLDLIVPDRSPIVPEMVAEFRERFMAQMAPPKPAEPVAPEPVSLIEVIAEIKQRSARRRAALRAVAPEPEPEPEPEQPEFDFEFGNPEDYDEQDEELLEDPGDIWDDEDMAA